MNDSFRRALGAHVAAHLLLHIALLTPPSVLSHARLAACFLPLICALHVSTLEHGLGYVAAIHALWAAELLLFRNPRRDFALLHGGGSPPRAAAASVEEDKDKRKADAREDEMKKKDKEKDKENENNNNNVDEVLERVTAAIQETKAKTKTRAKSAAAAAAANGSHRIAWTEQYPPTFGSRLVWVSKLVVSPRYVGWSTSASQAVLYASQPPAPSSSTHRSRSRSAFVLRKLLLVGVCVGILDLSNFYQYFDPYFQVEHSIDAALPPRLGGFFAAWHLSLLSPRLIRIAILALQQGATLTLVGAIPAILFVTLGGLGLVDDFWGRVESWPGIIGHDPAAVVHRGLRGVWGSFWHQLFRNILTGPGKALARALDFPEASTAAHATRVAVAFAISGILHAAALPSGVPDISHLRYASFFWVQGACVLYEIALAKAASGLGFGGPKPGWLRLALAAARIAWTALVLYHTVPVLEDELTRVSRILGLRPLWLMTLPE
ncbi:hypothetical protein LZ554_005794 [Drepanopeziza brunnea f. sp. 'monogermtubi']|nr:hypothetical protein LZ554_005794 [Drepanopeziza brunnea f. sp. 'monogermtubi']